MLTLTGPISEFIQCNGGDPDFFGMNRQQFVLQCRMSIIERINADYANVDMSNYQEYYDFSGVTIKPEEEKCCQELYSILDSVVQEVFANKDVNFEELSRTAAHNFQVNYLDKAD